MKNLSLKEHIRRSIDAVEANKAKGNFHGELLSEMYSEPGRFIEEILQNTEDAYEFAGKSGSIHFKLFDKGLWVYHNGKDFDEDDLKAITTFANTTKNAQIPLNLIGKFGIGFKSVFSITEFPEIHCHPYSFRIRDFEVLEEIEAAYTEKFRTGIYLPFKKGKEEQFHREIKAYLNALNYSFILFLRNITEIYVDNGKRQWSISRNSRKISSKLSITEIFKGKNKQSFLIISRDEPDSPALAFCYNEEKNEFSPVQESPVYVFFPTNEMSGLDFLLNGFFTTNPTREQIPLIKTTAIENLKLLHKAAQLLESSLTEVKRAGFLNVSFISCLPFQKIKTDNPFYAEFFDNIWEKFKSGRFFPMADMSHRKVEETIWVQDIELLSLLKKNELSELFYRAGSLHEDFRKKENLLLLDFFLKNFKIRVADWKGFSIQLDLHPQFLEKKNKSWWLQFFRLLSNHPELWDNSSVHQLYTFRRKSCIPVLGNKLSAPFDKEDEPVIYLRSKPRPQAWLLREKDIRDFFAQWGLPEYKTLIKKENKNSVTQDFFIPACLPSKCTPLFQTESSEIKKENRNIPLERIHQWCCELAKAQFPSEEYEQSVIAGKSRSMFSYKIKAKDVERIFSTNDNTILILIDLAGEAFPVIKKIRDARSYLKGTKESIEII